MEYRCVGGPLDGRTLNTDAQLVTLAEAPEMAYHRTRPTDSNWRAEYDPNWFIRGLPEPVPPDYVLEWHERDWVSPEVRMIRDAIQEAAARF